MSGTFLCRINDQLRGGELYRWWLLKNNLKISKGKSETVSRRTTNTWTKEQTTIYKTLHRKVMTKQQNTTQKTND
jgi:hypothetical protein